MGILILSHLQLSIFLCVHICYMHYTLKTSTYKYMFVCVKYTLPKITFTHDSSGHSSLSLMSHYKSKDSPKPAVHRINKNNKM